MPEKRDPWAGHTVVMDLRARAPFESAATPTRPFELAPAPGVKQEDEPASQKPDDFGSVTVLAPAPSLAAISAFCAASSPKPELPTQPKPAEALAADPTALPCAPTAPRSNALARLRTRVSDEFRRTPRGMRLALLALPIVAWAALGLGHPAEEPKPVARIAALAPALAVAPPLASAAPDAQLSAGSGRLPVNDENPPGKRTLQARAADAAARGARAEAVGLYEELARLNPTHAEFAAAARILQAKQGPR